MLITLSTCLVPECKAAGRSHSWEFERPTMQELLKIQEVLELDPDQFEEALNEGFSARAIRAVIMLVNLLHKREGILVSFEDTDLDMEYLDFVHDPTPEPDAPVGKEETTSPLPEEDDPGSSTSGPSPEAESEPRSSTTDPISGGSTA